MKSMCPAFPHRNLIGVFIAILLSFCIFSCKDSSDEDCGCDSNTNGTIEELNAIYHGNGHFTVWQEEDGSRGSFFQVCGKPDDSWETDTIPNYILSGDIKNPCFYGPTFTTQPGLIVITKLTKKLK